MFRSVPDQCRDLKRFISCRCKTPKKLKISPHSTCRVLSSARSRTKELWPFLTTFLYLALVHLDQASQACLWDSHMMLGDTVYLKDKEGLWSGTEAGSGHPLPTCLTFSFFLSPSLLPSYCRQAPREPSGTNTIYQAECYRKCS